MHPILMGFSLCLLGLRCVVTESPVTINSAGSLNIFDTAYSLILSFLLLTACAVWLFRALCRETLVYRPCGLGLGMFLLILAAVAAGLAAADKRAAISDSLMILTPILLCALLVQLLDSLEKIRLVLIILGALGLLSTYECMDQFFMTNQDTIEQYQEDPNSLLDVVGVETGTLEHFLFEHRIYSRGVKAFFTTRNSAGAFLLIALVALLTLWSEFKANSPGERSNRGIGLLFGLLTAILLVGLLLTRSKAAIGSLCLAGLMGALHYRWRLRIRGHEKRILCALAMLGLLATVLLVSYGLRHDRLPGGNSMLVRWQYWHAAGQMILDNPLLGVGPGNFADAYYRYKPSTGIESIADPHNLALSLLSRYGPLGLVCFLAMIAIPLFRRRVGTSCPEGPDQAAAPSPAKHHLLPYTFVLATFLLCTKPAIAHFMGDNQLLAVLSAFMHTLVLVAGLLILTTAMAGLSPTDSVPASHAAVTIPLGYGICALLLASMTDFALFEPGVATSFWALLACLIARRNQQLGVTHAEVPLPGTIRYIAMLLLIVCLALCFSMAVLPVARSSHQVALSNEALNRGNFPAGQRHLTRAAEVDPLSYAAHYRQGRLYLHSYLQGDKLERGPLEQAKSSFLAAIARNPADYKNYEKLSNVYALLGDEQEAIASAQAALSRYPQSARLHLALAALYERGGRVAEAIEHYQRTIDIEMQFQRQFQEMYPERDTAVSRLGVEELERARERLAGLRQESIVR